MKRRREEKEAVEKANKAKQDRGLEREENLQVEQKQKQDAVAKRETTKQHNAKFHTSREKS